MPRTRKYTQECVLHTWNCFGFILFIDTKASLGKIIATTTTMTKKQIKQKQRCQSVEGEEKRFGNVGSLVTIIVSDRFNAVMKAVESEFSRQKGGKSLIKRFWCLVSLRRVITANRSTGTRFCSKTKTIFYTNTYYIGTYCIQLRCQIFICF